METEISYIGKIKVLKSTRECRGAEISTVKLGEVSFNCDTYEEMIKITEKLKLSELLSTNGG